MKIHKLVWMPCIYNLASSLDGGPGPYPIFGIVRKCLRLLIPDSYIHVNY